MTWLANVFLVFSFLGVHVVVFRMLTSSQYMHYSVWCTYFESLPFDMQFLILTESLLDKANGCFTTSFSLSIPLFIFWSLTHFGLKIKDFWSFWGLNCLFEVMSHTSMIIFIITKKIVRVEHYYELYLNLQNTTKLTVYAVKIINSLSIYNYEWVKLDMW